MRIVREQTGYNWFLHNEIAAHSQNYQCQPQYDFCVIDGPKNWTIDGCAFFLVDKLLKNQGWIVFDDYNWFYASAEQAGRSATDGISHRQLSEAERNIPHIQEVFQLLVMQHPDYTRFKIHAEGDWAWAQKTPSSDRKQITLEYNYSYRDALSRVYKIANKFLKLHPTPQVKR
ncbi:MAG: hypothetical protein HC880_05815 [Bacteroidia bacterium]|nr:hypothetical protein [Bacteroidia bacterium]